MKQDTRKIYLRTFGCQMNERDSEIILSMMMQEGYTCVSSYEEADLIIFNTCSVRRHAEDRVWGKMGQLQTLKEKNKGIILGLVGCMGKAYGKDIFKRLGHIDFVCGPANIYDIPNLVEKVKNGKRHILAVSREERPLKEDASSYREERVRAWVNISEGCNNFCSYCIVPYVRGREVSRPCQDIVDEIRHLAQAGVKEVTLLGQNVNSYKDEKTNFVKLLERINNIDALRRIRFMTSHPKDAGLELFKAIHSLDKVCAHLHLPLQSGSDRILKAMNRGYTASHYLRLVDELGKEMPGCAITTDIIVGFPSEREKDFMDTYLLMQRIAFDSAFIFKYSPRPFTRAARMKDDVPKEEKEQRNQALLSLQNKISRQKSEALVGEARDVLGLEEARRRPSSSSDLSEFYIKGRTETNRQVVYRADKSLIGAVSFVRIREVQEHTLIGELA